MNNLFDMDISPCSSYSSTSSSSNSSAVHHASLIDPACHSPAILDLIDIKITRAVIDYLVDCVSETVDYALGRPTSSSRSRGRSPTRRPELAKFTTFVTNVITRAEITTPVVLAALVYVDRAKPHLHIALEEWALERVFLGALIVASKYLNDSTLKNVHWAACTGVFGKRDVGRIEREFLDVLDFELGFQEDDILAHHDGLMALSIYPLRSIRSDLYSSSHPQSPKHSRRHRRSTAPISVHIPLPESIPSFEHSSPESATSSTSSSSPDTPSTLNSDVSSPATTPDRYPSSHHDLLKSHHQNLFELQEIPTRSAPPECPVPESVAAAAVPAPAPRPSIPSKRTFHSTTMELLRSFPISLPPAVHQHRDKGVHSRFPIRFIS